MENIPNLEELLNYGEEYQYPDLIMSDYFRIDNTRTKENKNQKKSNEQSQDQSQEQSSEQETEEQTQEQSSEQETEEQSQDQNSEQQTEEQTQEQSSEQETEEQSQDQNSEQEAEEQTQEQSLEQQTDEQSQGQNSEQQTDEQSQEQSSEQETEEQSQDQNSEPEIEENDFDDLMNNYDENHSREQEDKQHEETHSASDKLDDITTTKIYKVLKKLVSLSYERYQKGTYKYDKKEIVKHYLTNQKFKIIDDFVSPTFKPDVYVFDLSPSNNESLEMYVNAISSVAIKNSLIYLTYNDCILRKLLIKKENAKNIDVSKIVNSEIKSYNNFECTIFNEYRSLYEELKDIKDRKIYIFSDFDISRDISKLSQENQSIVWFSTEKDYDSYNFFYREYPSSYIGYYVETSGIEDIEKFVREKNKNKYKGRLM